MTIPAFLEVVEARTKLASILPCLVGLGFSLAYFHQVNGLNSLLFFLWPCFVSIWPPQQSII